MIKHIEIVNEWGKTLRGYLDMPDNFKGELVVMFHGFTGNKSEHANHFHNFSKILSTNGFASLRMDFSGNGESDGEFSEFTMDTMMSEAKQIVEYAFAVSKVKKVVLLGFSMGGAVAGMLSGFYGNRISKVVLWSAAANICEKIRQCFDNGEKLENGNSLHGYFELSKEMYDSTFKYDTYKDISNFTNPVLIIHGRADKAVEYLYSMKYSVSYYNSVAHIIDGCGHGYDKVSERDELYKKSIDFLLKDYKIK